MYVWYEFNQVICSNQPNLYKLKIMHMHYWNAVTFGCGYFIKKCLDKHKCDNSVSSFLSTFSNTKYLKNYKRAMFNNHISTFV